MNNCPSLLAQDFGSQVAGAVLAERIPLTFDPDYDRPLEHRPTEPTSGHIPSDWRWGMSGFG